MASTEEAPPEMSSSRGAPRLVVVLGYSGRARGLHEICASRLRRAEQEARPGDVVLLSGRPRRRRRETEAELMARAWSGDCAGVLLDRDARTTLSNAVGAAQVATEQGTGEVVLVTSGWHGRRAATLLEAALAGSETDIVLAVTDDPGSRRARLRERACWLIVPLQRRLAATRVARASGARVEAG
jgi:uncharacterized SAM-binding protein YcdF (DUF218 family)